MRRRASIEDDVSAALRRAFGFAGLFGLTAVAAIACTARNPQPVTGIAADRLAAQEALWQAEVSGTPAIAFPAPLLARRADPKVAGLLAGAQHQLAADRTAAAARRTVVLNRMAQVRADRDLHESQRTVLSLKIEQAYGMAQQRRDDPALQREVMALKIQAAKANGDIALANREMNVLNDRMMSLANAEHARAEGRLAAVREQLRGG
ncbi:hypothetical protein [Sphingomonas sp. 8AM]|uniref:hypothetical protein n=1 Tax=Sphingomonas sp. 8AM TaxID=2653170 RepID=UPI0012F0E463|nr:hypothetical protein [Sphingomonas sp. 8AM]VXC84984.1 conserved hypothetical protein [Sphingomonas sp. 8AM]